MASEIEILLHAARRNWEVVEKASNLAWSRPDLEQARAAGEYSDEDELLPAECALAVTSPYPGCPQGSALSSLHCEALGQTRHFVVFVSDTGEHDAQA